jgi:hypothetical protein
MFSKLFFAAFITVLSFSFSLTNNSKSQIQKDIQGEWISFQDSNYTVYISKKIIVEKYSGDSQTDTSSYRISKRNCHFDLKLCAENCYFLKKIDLKTKEEECYLIKDVSKVSFTLVHEGGQILNFTRRSIPER